MFELFVQRWSFPFNINSLLLEWKKFIHSNDKGQDQSISQSTVPKLTLNFKSDSLSLDSITS